MMKLHEMTRTVIVGVFCTALVVVCSARDAKAADPAATATEWRDDPANLEIVEETNRVYGLLPFSRDHDGVLDDCPFALAWKVGPNLPIAFKGGVAGLIGGEIIISGGLWMPERDNLTLAYTPETQTYRRLPPPPIRPQYTQGVCDGKALFIVGGRGCGRNVYRLSRTGRGKWQWSNLPQLPECDQRGRWLAAAGIVPGKWLLLVGGHSSGSASETAGSRRPPDLRLRLDRADAGWERMAEYPGGKRNLIIAAVAGSKLYVFGGSDSNATARSVFMAQLKKHGVSPVPHNGVPNYRDAYRYDPDADRWEPIRSLPFPMVAGAALVFDDRFVLLMGTADVATYRVGKTKGSNDPRWTGYGDQILCYDRQRDKYSRVGIMPYGVATAPWVADGVKVYGFGGEPSHNYNLNTENVLQIGTIQRR